MNEFLKHLSEKHNFNLNEEWVMYNKSKPKASKEESFKHILEAISLASDIAKEDILGRCRKREIVCARHLLVYILCDKKVSSLQGIGRMMSNRNHSTIIHSNRLVKDLLSIKDGLMYPIYIKTNQILNETNTSSSTI